MSLTETFSEASGNASERYLIMTGAFQSVYSTAVGEGVYSELTTNGVRDELRDIGHTHYYAEEMALRQEMQDVISQARTSAMRHLGYESSKISLDTVYDAYNAQYEFTKREIATQIERDISQIIKRYRNFGIKVELIRTTNGWSEASSHSTMLMKEKRDKLWFRDRAGRRVPSQRYIRTLWKSSLRDLYVQAYLSQIAVFGEKFATIWHPNPKHKSFGSVIYLDGREPAYDDLKDTVFHPNSDALPMVAKYFEDNFT